MDSRRRTFPTLIRKLNKLTKDLISSHTGASWHAPHKLEEHVLSIFDKASKCDPLAYPETGADAIFEQDIDDVHHFSMDAIDVARRHHHTKKHWQVNFREAKEKDRPFVYAKDDIHGGRLTELFHHKLARSATPQITETLRFCYLDDTDKPRGMSLTYHIHKTQEWVLSLTDDMHEEEMAERRVFLSLSEDHAEQLKGVDLSKFTIGHKRIAGALSSKMLASVMNFFDKDGSVIHGHIEKFKKSYLHQGKKIIEVKPITKLLPVSKPLPVDDEVVEGLEKMWRRSRIFTERSIYKKYVNNILNMAKQEIENAKELQATEVTECQEQWYKLGAIYTKISALNVPEKATIQQTIREQSIRLFFHYTQITETEPGGWNLRTALKGLLKHNITDPDDLFLHEPKWWEITEGLRKFSTTRSFECLESLRAPKWAEIKRVLETYYSKATKEFVKLVLQQYRDTEREQKKYFEAVLLFLDMDEVDEEKSGAKSREDKLRVALSLIDDVTPVEAKEIESIKHNQWRSVLADFRKQLKTELRAQQPVQSWPLIELDLSIASLSGRDGTFYNTNNPDYVPDSLQPDLEKLLLFPKIMNDAKAQKFFEENIAMYYQDSDMEGGMFAESFLRAMYPRESYPKKTADILGFNYLSDDGIYRGVCLNYNVARPDEWALSICDCMTGNDPETRRAVLFISEHFADSVKNLDESKLMVGHYNIQQALHSKALAAMMVELFEEDHVIHSQIKAFSKSNLHTLSYIPAKPKKEVEEKYSSEENPPLLEILTKAEPVFQERLPLKAHESVSVPPKMPEKLSSLWSFIKKIPLEMIMLAIGFGLLGATAVFSFGTTYIIAGLVIIGLVVAEEVAKKGNKWWSAENKFLDSEKAGFHQDKNKALMIEPGITSRMTHFFCGNSPKSSVPLAVALAPSPPDTVVDVAPGNRVSPSQCASIKIR